MVTLRSPRSILPICERSIPAASASASWVNWRASRFARTALPSLERSRSGSVCPETRATPDTSAQGAYSTTVFTTHCFRRMPVRGLEIPSQVLADCHVGGDFRYGQTGGSVIVAALLFVASSAPQITSVPNPSADDLLNTAPANLGDTRRALRPQAPYPDAQLSQRRAAHVAALTGGKGVAVGGPANTTPDISDEQAREAAAVKRENARRIAEKPTPYLTMMASLIALFGAALVVKSRIKHRFVG